MPSRRSWQRAAAVLVITTAAISVGAGRGGRGSASRSPQASSAPGSTADNVAPAASPDSLASPGPPDASEPDEVAWMASLRSARLTSSPREIVARAREGGRRFPDGKAAPERTATLIHALVDDGRPAEARGEAENMVNLYPDSSWVREIEQFTGAHRHRTLRLDDAGQIESF